MAWYDYNIPAAGASSKQGIYTDKLLLQAATTVITNIKWRIVFLQEHKLSQIIHRKYPVFFWLTEEQLKDYLKIYQSFIQTFLFDNTGISFNI